MIRDTRPVLKQVQSGFKIVGIGLLVCAALLVLLSFLPTRRIEAWAWHWRHGNSLQVAEFRVPVPNEWEVQRFESGMTQEVELINTKGGKPFWATITITEEQRQRKVALGDWASSRRRMMEKLGMNVTDARNLVIEGVAGFCLDGETSMAGIAVRNISCRLGTGFVRIGVRHGSSLKATRVLLDSGWHLEGVEIG